MIFLTNILGSSDECDSLTFLAEWYICDSTAGASVHKANVLEILVVCEADELDRFFFVRGKFIEPQTSNFIGMNYALNHDHIVSDVRSDTGMAQMDFLCFYLESSSLEVKFFSLLQVRIIKRNNTVGCDEISSSRH